MGNKLSERGKEGERRGEKKREKKKTSWNEVTRDKLKRIREKEKNNNCG